MTDKMKPMSTSARAVLTLASTRADCLVQLPRLPVAAGRQVIRAMLNAGLVEELQGMAVDPAYVWRTGQNGEVIGLRATALGLTRVVECHGPAIATVSIDTAGDAVSEVGVSIGAAQEGSLTAVMSIAEDVAASKVQVSQDAQDRPDDGNPDVDAALVSFQVAEAAQKPSTAVGRRNHLRQAAQAVLDTWDELTGGERNIADALIGPIADLRAAVATKVPSGSGSIELPCASRETKQARVLAMLRRNEGASGPEIADEMSWAPHTVRGFLAGLPKKGIAVSVLERVRQVGPNKIGAKGSYTVYRVIDTPQP